MIRKIKFPLLIDNEEIRTIEELKKNFDVEKVVEYFFDGRLKIWLQQREYTNELSMLEKLESLNDRHQIPLELCKIFNVEYSDNKVDISGLEKRNKRLSVLKSYTDDESWKEKLEDIAFTQEELEKKLSTKNSNIIFEVYLCGEIFAVSDKFKDIAYIGINTPSVKLISDKVFDAKANNIKFQNVKITSDVKLDLKIKEYKTCIIDYNKINLKKMDDIKYCKTFLTNNIMSVIVDNTGNVNVFGIIANSEKKIPKFDAPIIDIDFDYNYVSTLIAAVDKNGKVYQWGDTNHIPSIPNNLPRIKQVTVGRGFIIVLDEFGKIHWWGSSHYEHDFDLITGKSKYGQQLAKPMPNITSKIVQVICGYGVMALDENGKVYRWGYKEDDDKNMDTPNDLPFIKKIQYCGDVVLALDEYGKLHAWGLGKINIPQNLPCITDISSNRKYDFSAIDDNGIVYYLNNVENMSKEIARELLNSLGGVDIENQDILKRLPKIKHLSGFGGIDDNGYIYICYESGIKAEGIKKDFYGPQFDGLKAMLPIK